MHSATRWHLLLGPTLGLYPLDHRDCLVERGRAWAISIHLGGTMVSLEQDIATTFQTLCSTRRLGHGVFLHMDFHDVEWISQYLECNILVYSSSYCNLQAHRRMHQNSTTGDRNRKIWERPQSSPHQGHVTVQWPVSSLTSYRVTIIRKEMKCS